MRNKPLPGLNKCSKCNKLKSICGCDYKKSPVRKSPLRGGWWAKQTKGHGGVS